MYLKGKGEKKRWDSMTITPKGKEVRLLKTTTKGWYDLAFDNTLYTYSFHNHSGSYHESKILGKLLTSKNELNKQTIEHFGLSWTVASDWSWQGGGDKFNSHQNGRVNYQGFLPGANKKAAIYVSLFAKDFIDELKTNISDVPYNLTNIGSGLINGHGVDVFYLDIKGTKNNHGEVIILFKDKMNFHSPKKISSDLFSRNVSLRLMGDLFTNLKIPKDIQFVLDKYVEPFFNTIRITKGNTFAAQTTNQTIAFELIYHKPNSLDKVGTSENNVQELMPVNRIKKPNPKVKTSIPTTLISTKVETLQPLLDKQVYQANDLFTPFASFKTAPIRGKRFIWNNFLVYTKEGWSRDNTKSDDGLLVLKTGILKREMVTLNSSSFQVEENLKDYMINEIYKSIKDDPSYKQVKLYMHSNYRILDNPVLLILHGIFSCRHPWYTRFELIE